MRRLVVAALALACLSAAPPDDDGPAPLDDQLAALADAPASFDANAARAIGFDHRIHDRKLTVAGKESLACTRCHALAQGKLVGRPGHGACFGACHGGAPGAKLAVAADQVRVCSACHAGAQLAARVAGKQVAIGVSYPPYTIDRDFGLSMSHQRHASAPCETCHFTSSAKRAPHARCIGCHAPVSVGAGAAPAERSVTRGLKDGAPPMSACATCHPDAYGPASGPRIVEGALALVGFDHARHRARAAGATCRSCHATIAADADASLDPPSTASCATCHDGKTAFATTVACSRCHTRAPLTTYRPPRPVARFSHAAHASRTGDVACASCHALDRRGEATAPGHAACAGCHADDFSSVAPEICGACHIATEPWRALIVDRPPAPETEFGARLSHRSHAQACATCHSSPSSARELRPPRGHAACASCHAKNAAPHLDDCAACHVLGSAAQRTRDRLDAPWSVRARFRHAPHAGAACTTCHAGAGDATALAEVPAPPKSACAPCHDGATAFKLTGTTCARCHGKAP